jgi:hypothetical protein
MTDHRLCIWPVGKFIDKEIDIIPNSYLHWAIDQDWFNDKYPNLSNIVVEELAWREKHGVVIK